MLIIFGGLSGVGKTTISKRLAYTMGAVHLRIDTIETAITASSLNVKDSGNAGYLAAYDLAKDNLLLGHTIIADSVNPISITRDAWKEIAANTGKEFIEIEVICSDKNEHRRRVKTRLPDIKGHILPTWQETLDRELSCTPKFRPVYKVHKPAMEGTIYDWHTEVSRERV